MATAGAATEARQACPRGEHEPVMAANAAKAEQTGTAAALLDEPTPKSRNSYLRTIAALGYALIDGPTGKPHTDSDAILTALAAKGVEGPLKSETLAGYLKQATGV
ncbi:hypothetical protein FQZ97_950740 [compost metagenome]